MQVIMKFAKAMKQNFLVLPFAFKDKRTPLAAKIIAFFTFAYGCSPIDLIPDFIPVIGYLDDMIIVPAGIYLSIKLIPEEVWLECKQKQALTHSRKPKNYFVAVLIVALWMYLAFLLGKYFFPNFHFQK